MDEKARGEALRVAVANFKLAFETLSEVAEENRFYVSALSLLKRDIRFLEEAMRALNYS